MARRPIAVHAIQNPFRQISNREGRCARVLGDTAPLRYPGGKARLAKYIASLLDDNGLTGGECVEPYAGGAGVGLALLYLEYAQQIHLNDLNWFVHAFWRAALDHPEELSRLIRDCPLNMDEWRRQRAIQKADAPSILELGFSTLYMNRTNRSGVIKGGVIGGNAQEGTWKIDARFNRTELEARITKFASYASRISLYNDDALELIKRLGGTLPDRSLIYLDPPYYRKADRLYDNHYRPADHAALAEALKSINRPWLVSYDDQPEIRALYANFHQETFGIGYSAGKVARGSEVMIFGPDMVAVVGVTT